MPHMLIINAGSSSVKVTVFATDTATSALEQALDMTADNIGQPAASITITLPNTSPITESVHITDHSAAAQLLIERIMHNVRLDSLIGIGHRLVHGGPKYTQPTRVTDISESDWKLLLRLDPQHTPAARQLIDRLAKLCPHIPQIACFDTAFFHDLPYAAQILPLPQKYYTEGVRKYGFHGLSYSSLQDSFLRIAGETAVNGRVILAHLGSGASLTATRGGKPIDTTMSFTPTSGITMSNRSGDLDPTIFSFLHRQHNMGIDAFDHMVNFESGLLGMSNRTSDMRALLELETTDTQAAVAIEVFVRDIKKTIGAFSALLGGVDSLIFSGGIGEKSDVLRERICQGLDYIGIKIDAIANKKHATLISAADSSAGVHVIPTNEALIIAKQITKALSKVKD